MPLAEDVAKAPTWPRLIDIIGPGLITGASDDDLSGIATYSQTGAQFGYDLRLHYPRWLLFALVGMLVVANTINIGADLGAMAAALKLLVDGSLLLYVLFFAITTLLLETLLRYSRYVSVLKCHGHDDAHGRASGGDGPVCRPRRP